MLANLIRTLFSWFRRKSVAQGFTGVPHTKLWPGIDLKLQNAAEALTKMRNVLRPSSSAMHAVLESTGARVGGPDWQNNFWPLVPLFLVEVRSIPWNIEACFGHDRSPRVKAWWDSLSPGEQQRRKAFSKQFRRHRKAIDRHDLTTQRDVVYHRVGIATTEARVIGPFGGVFIATPLKRIPDVESRPPDTNIANDDGAKWAATLSPEPIWPKPDQFTITKNKKPLFAECERYLALAEQAVSAARQISQNVHGSDSLIPPD
jgi:hypothetical protein